MVVIIQIAAFYVQTCRCLELIQRNILPDDIGNMFLNNNCNFLQDCMVLI
jgi:hypothetical protein